MSGTPQETGGTATARPVKQGGGTPARETLGLKVGLALDDGAFEGVRVEELYDAVVEAVENIIKLAYTVVDDEGVCEPATNEYASGIGFYHYANTCCLGRLADGRHVHVSGTYGNVSNRTYARVEKVVLEAEEV